MGKPEKKGSAAETTTSVLDKCVAEGCKSGASRFSFCSEHYEHFKFGLIKKTGQQVSDYDKKYGHYVAYTQAITARKAA